MWSVCSTSPRKRADSIEMIRYEYKPVILHLHYSQSCRSRKLINWVSELKASGNGQASYYKCIRRASRNVTKLKRIKGHAHRCTPYSTSSFSNPVRVLSRAQSALLERFASRSRSEQVQSEKRKERKGECELVETTSRYAVFIQKKIYS